jgi:hypothetical protein
MQCYQVPGRGGSRQRGVRTEGGLSSCRRSVPTVPIQVTMAALLGRAPPDGFLATGIWSVVEGVRPKWYFAFPGLLAAIIAQPGEPKG